MPTWFPRTTPFPISCCPIVWLLLPVPPLVCFCPPFSLHIPVHSSRLLLCLSIPIIDFVPLRARLAVQSFSNLDNHKTRVAGNHGNRKLSCSCTRVRLFRYPASEPMWLRLYRLRLTGSKRENNFLVSQTSSCDHEYRIVLHNLGGYTNTSNLLYHTATSAQILNSSWF